MVNIQTTTDDEFNLKFVGDMTKDTVKRTVKISTNISAQSFGDFDQLVESSFTKIIVVGSTLIAVT